MSYVGPSAWSVPCIWFSVTATARPVSGSAKAVEPPAPLWPNELRRGPLTPGLPIAHAGVDVVLCDLMMPGLAGPEVFTRACARHPELSSRFVFMTGGATTPETSHFAATTENLVIDKPIEIKNLQRILRRLLLAEHPRTVRPDRRHGRRFRAQGILGYFDTSDRVRDIAVVDYSTSGLRVAGAGQVPDQSSTSTVSLYLFRADHAERVHAEVRRVRVVPGGSETCLQIVSMNQASERVYQDWLRRAERDAAGAAHERG